MKFSSLVLSLTLTSVGAFLPTTPLKKSHGIRLFSTAEDVETTAGGVKDVTMAVSTTTESTAVVDGNIELVNGVVQSGMAVSMPIPSTPDKSRIKPGRYNDKENSIAVPFLKRPPALDGSHAGDYGFDPLGFTEQYDLYTMQEAELRHARLAMLAVIGWPVSELVAPDWMLQYGCAPSVLNGFNPLSFLATLAAFGGLGYFEYKTALRRVDDKRLGMIHREDMADVWKWGVAGDYNFDPLNLYSSIGNDAYARKGLRDLEISHGRSAMLGITGFAAWEALTGHPIVENSMFFHPNPLLPALVIGYVAFNQFYELEDSDMFIRFKLSSEGEARMENLKLGMGPKSSGDSPSLPDLGETVDKVSNFVSTIGEKYEQAQQAYLDNVVKVDKISQE